MIRALLLATFALLSALPLQARAQERILSYDSTVAVNADGSMDVEERIRVRAEGEAIRRGIYRDFPTRYRDRHGNRVVVDFTVKDVLRDGRPEPWFTERQSNGVRLNTGNDDFLPVPAEYTYTLRYRTSRQLGFFADHDELYWNAIGTGWAFPIEAGSVDVRLPRTVASGELRAECYTGAQGAQGQACIGSATAAGEAHWKLTGPLAPQEGLTIALSFPKGVVVAPTAGQRTWWLLKDNRGVLVALAALLAMLAYMLRRWRQVGRDPAPGIVIARYQPPAGYSPAALRFIRRMNSDTRCITADLLALAVAGHLRIEREKGLLKDDWTLHRLPGGDVAALAESPRALLAGLFRDGDTLELKNSNHALLQAAIAAQSKAMEKAYAGRMFQRNYGSMGIAFAIGAAGLALAAVLSGGAGILLIAIIGALMLAAVITFAFLVPAPTAEGRKLLDEIEGLKLYLGVAERDELARLPGPDAPPPLDAQRYQFLLPYALALDVEAAWTEKFTVAVGAAAAEAATANIGWYRGGNLTSLNQLTSSLGSSLGSQIASASSPPGSSSGSGGGGFSGGGGGGGGGGGR
ncbi:DUF2207 domain-containing protein [Thermomonas fusca]|uniref:DUF2207 domain-containing protein n=1 Tax=Thermomonas fusca TaxID=215690 RepID=A0A5R9PGD8_9GAMM|nr:DUF2207 domain-containing protein [Thermomonas fusca]TLX21670.1 DUF2207 domain-containing protein [Thermomonas fusca]